MCVSHPCVLLQQNYSQGLGFVVRGTVLTKAQLLQTAAQLGAKIIETPPFLKEESDIALPRLKCFASNTCDANTGTVVSMVVPYILTLEEKPTIAQENIAVRSHKM